MFVFQIDVTEAVVAQRELQLALTQLAEDKVFDGKRVDKTMPVLDNCNGLTSTPPPVCISTA